MDLLRLWQILTILALLSGIAYLSFLIVRKSRFPKMAWIIQIEFAVYLIAMDVLICLHLYGVEYLYGVETKIAYALAPLFFLFAALTTSVVFLVNKLRSSRHG